MEFQIEKNSPLSVIQQIQEQIKLSIAMRVLKRGVVLPPIREVADFKHLLKDSQYDRILVSPGARNKVPVELHQSSRIYLSQMDLDPEALEITRIRAGVIV